jgi:hypothetical protein
MEHLEIQKYKFTNRLVWAPGFSLRRHRADFKVKEF